MPTVVSMKVQVSLFMSLLKKMPVHLSALSARLLPNSNLAVRYSFRNVSEDTAEPRPLNFLRGKRRTLRCADARTISHLASSRAFRGRTATDVWTTWCDNTLPWIKLAVAFWFTVRGNARAGTLATGSWGICVDKRIGSRGTQRTEYVPEQGCGSAQRDRCTLQGE
jgi:hypothetical protein